MHEELFYPKRLSGFGKVSWLNLKEVPTMGILPRLIGG